MKRRAIIATIGLCTIMAGTWGAVSAPGSAQPAAAALPSPNARLVIGVLDPVSWRALPAPGHSFAEWEKWAINRNNRGPLQVDVSAVAAEANRLANRRVRVYGEFRSARTADGTRVRYLRAQLIEAVK